MNAFICGVWCHSPHIKKLDPALNTTLQTVFGCLEATLTNQLPVLAGIAPTDVRSSHAVPRSKGTDVSHLLHKIATETPQHLHLKSQCPFATHAQELFCTAPSDTSKAAWVKARWRDQERSAELSRLHLYIEDPTDWPATVLKAMDNPQLPEDRCRMLWGSNAKMGSHGQCPLRMRGSTTNYGTHNNQLPQTPATKLRSWFN